MAEEGWVGVEEVAAHLRVAQASIYRWVETKGFPAHRVGRLLRFKLSEVDEWVKDSGGGSDTESLSKASSKTASRKPQTKKKSGHG